MESSNTSNTVEAVERKNLQSGHWLPHLRPDHDEESKEHSQPNRPLETNTVADDTPIEPTTQPSSDEVALSMMPETAGPDMTTLPQPAPTITSATCTPWASTDEDELLEDDDDERLDPSWGFKRMSTQQILATVDRSTTFPSLATPAATEEVDDTSFFDQVEAAPTQEQIEAPPVLPDAEMDVYRTQAPQDPVPDGDRLPVEGADSDEELDEPPIGASSLGLDDVADARFEEGLPLMEQEMPEETSTREAVQHASHNQLSSWGDADEDISFFSGMTAEAPKHAAAPELTRKSTSTVVDNLHVQLKRSAEEPASELDSPQGNDMTDGLAASTGTNAQSKSADVEDMWKAIIEDDDEFLVEDPDDLLPDSDPGSPSSFNALLQDSADIPNSAGGHLTEPAAGASLQQTPPSAKRSDFERQQSANPYAPHQPSNSELAQLSPTTHGQLGFSRPGLGPMNSFQAHLQQRPSALRAESFADQAKGGYKSPYDLPMELSKPKKRPVVQQLQQTTKPVPPPPRSSSMSDKQLQSPFSPSTPAFPFPAPARPNQAIAPVLQQRTSTASVPPPSSVKQKPSSSSFFEELPIITKPRSGSGGGRYTPQHSQNIPPPQILPQSPPQSRLPPSQPSPPRQADPYSQFQLRAPERVDPFTNMPIQPSAYQPSSLPLQPPVAPSNPYSPAPPATLAGPRPGPSPRYSPAPHAQQSNTPPGNRYASQPAKPPPAQLPPQLDQQGSLPSPPHPAQTIQSTAVPLLPFQPRTSSPLAYHKSSMGAAAPSATVTGAPPRAAPSHYDTARVPSPLSSIGPPSAAPLSNFYSSPPTAIAPDGAIAGSRRSQTQSPSKRQFRPPVSVPSNNAYTRPASAHGQMSPIRSHSQIDSIAVPRADIPARGFEAELDFVQPTDETQYDPFQRWKGSPVFHFGFGGTVVSTFPKRIPRYSAGAVRPQIKCAVGEVLLRNIQDIIHLPEHLSSFPGPLRTKSKKKDLISWINNRVVNLEADGSAVLSAQTLPDPRRRHQEKILLWKMVKSLVEHDGALDGNADALKSVNQILSPELFHLDDASATQYRDSVISPSGTYRPRGASLKVESVDPMAMQTVQKHLLRGARQDAVWYAVDKRLWSHALLIASTCTRDVWRQVVQEFVKHEVRTAGENAESLSALYEIFGGNLEESIDQLVPPSARAGLQMVSRVEYGGPTKNALDGLDKWKETLSLVINNRSAGDQGALLALGKLLSDYGRIEAAHICYLFARSPTNPVFFGGADDPQTIVALLGADHQKQPFNFARDYESLLLTEACEFATLVLAGAPTSFMPYLSAYKLQKANLLADSGFKAEAQSYCDALVASIKSTKAPAYYHPIFLGELEDLSNRLKQVPIQNSGSWMAKPSIEKVSGSLLSKLSSFVAGDDSDAASQGSGRDATEAGPFAKVAGTPSLSRHGSQSDIYGSYPNAASAPSLPQTLAGSRYAPNGFGSARSSSELTRGRPSLDSQRSPPTSSYGNAPRPSPYDPINMHQPSQTSPPVNPYQSLSFGASPPSSNYQSTPPQNSYMPSSLPDSSPARHVMPPRQESYIPTPPPEQPQSMPYEPRPMGMSETHAPASDSPAFGGYVPVQHAQFGESVPTERAQDGPYQTDSQSYGYGYEPSSTEYTPYVPEPDSPKDVKPKKRSMLDDDDFPGASRPDAPEHSASAPSATLSADGNSRRAANDAAADAAFRAAAEADAARAAEKKKDAKSAGWFGGWLGGGKKPDSLDSPSAGQSRGGEPKVYRAKLGETKMKLYYDEKLKKWVNPDNPDAATKSTATPPPPRAASGTPGSGPAGGPPMGPPRSISAMAPPTSSPALGPSSGSPAMDLPTGSPALGTPAAGSGPPSRAGTPASTGISSTLPPNVTEGLGLAPPGPPSGARPSSAMSNASSIDDLLGAGGAGMGRKSVKGKKGVRGRYVDVMAK